MKTTIKNFKKKEISKANQQKIKGGSSGCASHGYGRLFYDFDGSQYTITSIEWFA
ncbi:hypothetical protein [Dysgonomonas macrotermitis]|uniref:Uncharacterized protein n=1 Tax=Dysgonomonas macrotermitis TaxID=1346286 RepID=A0A1M4SZM5_9BACT|nr:hypothetical protein [Dysgonomonas macrotermitis]SHE37634.1 hypothetical protein SAMN05444362_101194 [Dysgonomonas macrotermitis]